MPTPVAHSLAGAIAYALATRRSMLFRSWRWLLLCVLFAAMADLDFLPGLFGRLDLANRFHRRLSHSFLFAILASATAYVVLKSLQKQKPLRNSILLLSCAMSHILLDLLGKDLREPIGLPLLWPFVRRSFKIPIEIFPDLRKDTYAEMFSFHTLRVVAGEILFFGALLFIVIALKLRATPGKDRATRNDAFLPEATGKASPTTHLLSPSDTQPANLRASRPPPDKGGWR